MFNKLLTGLQKDLSFSQYSYCLDIFSNPNIREQDKSLRYSRRELHTLPSTCIHSGFSCSICLFLLMFCSSLCVLLSSLTIVLSVLLRFTASDYQFGIFKLFFLWCIERVFSYIVFTFISKQISCIHLRVLITHMFTASIP
jgi:hypothetical protein